MMPLHTFICFWVRMVELVLIMSHNVEKEIIALSSMLSEQL